MLSDFCHQCAQDWHFLVQYSYFSLAYPTLFILRYQLCLAHRAGIGGANAFTEDCWVRKLLGPLSCASLILLPPGVARPTWQLYTMSASMWKVTTMAPRHLREKTP